MTVSLSPGREWLRLLGTSEAQARMQRKVTPQEAAIGVPPVLGRGNREFIVKLPFLQRWAPGQ
jgi:hypothetical protein